MPTFRTPQSLGRSGSSLAELSREADARGPRRREIEMRPLSQHDVTLNSERSGINPEVFAACRRAAARLGIVIMFRHIKPSARFWVSQYDCRPKPVQVKLKCERETGMIRLTHQQLEVEKGRDPIFRQFVLQEKCKADKHGYLVDGDGRRFFADMDLYDIFNANTGRQIPVGDGRSEGDLHASNRLELDRLINVLADIPGYELIAHGAERQWVKHKPQDEIVSAFVPSGEFFVFQNLDSINDFIATVQDRRLAEGREANYDGYASQHVNVGVHLQKNKKK